MSCSCALEYRSEVANFASTSFNTCSAAGTANARSERRIRLLARTENENNGCGMHNSAEYAAKRAIAAKPILKILMHSLCNMTCLEQQGLNPLWRRHSCLQRRHSCRRLVCHFASAAHPADQHRYKQNSKPV